MVMSKNYDAKGVNGTDTGADTEPEEETQDEE